MVLYLSAAIAESARGDVPLCLPSRSMLLSNFWDKARGMWRGNYAP